MKRIFSAVWITASIPLQMVMRLRWPLIIFLVGIFVLGQVIATLLIDSWLARLLFDIFGWGLLSVATVWLSLAWARKREQRHQADLEEALQNQQELNRKLQRANSHLALLSETSDHIAASSTLDDILAASLVFPQRLVPAQAAALLLIDAAGAIEIRTEGAEPGEIARLRSHFGIVPRLAETPQPQLLIAPEWHENGLSETTSPRHCLVLPLHDGLAPVGWIELYLERQVSIPIDELQLLETIGSEIAEAIVSARRRSQHERAVYELERAIAEERARIARDIHDGLAQSLAFVRMRVDLWQDWIAGDPQRLRAELADLKHTLRGQIRELRRAIFALRPIQFDELGFVGGLRRYIVEFADQQGWETDVDLKGAPPVLSLELEAICFRIVQEALTNAAKHAAATSVEVKIDQIDTGLHIVVRDNGRGFDPDLMTDNKMLSNRYGLLQMYERLSAVRGQLTLQSQPDQGTALYVWIPLSQEMEPGSSSDEVQ